MSFVSSIWSISVALCLSILKLAAAEDQQVVSFSTTEQLLTIGKSVYIYEDEDQVLDYAAVKKMPFYRYEKSDMINLGFTRSNIWLRFTINNQTSQDQLYLMLRQPSIDVAALYAETEDGLIKADTLGRYKPFQERYVNAPDYIFPIEISQNETKTFYMLVSSNDQLHLPLFIGTEAVIHDRNLTKNLLFGLYAGAVLIMMLYNLFLTISTKSSDYSYYILYILFVGLTQAMFQGYAFMYLWPQNTWLAKYSSIIVPVLSGLTTLAFIRSFLYTKRHSPKLNRGINVIVFLYLVGLILGLVDVYSGVIFLQIAATTGILYILYVADQIRRNGYRPAKFFLLAFTLFFLCVILFVLRNFNLIPYNNFTLYILEIGSILEILLLSFALADRINFYRRAKEISQNEALKISQENTRIIREHNVLLELEVNKRTADLQQTNQSLEETMYNLKQTQTQLVESEKLASLGMLTAGIAHEINNPINFVSASAKPLKRDIDQIIEAIAIIEQIGLSDDTLSEKEAAVKVYKEEIEFEYLQEEIKLLLNGIEDGAMRTAEIVKSLRIFSRVDEYDLKMADLNLGLKSTLVILNSLYKDKIKIERGFGVIPHVECFPGKLNQVFLNLITNAIHAVDEKFQGAQGGKISISTYCEGENVFIRIADNGVGIKESMKTKIFDPFFTTKDVGEGVGLGLSVVLQTINKHNGRISLITEEDKGCEFIIQLPITQIPAKESADELN